MEESGETGECGCQSWGSDAEVVVGVGCGCIRIGTSVVFREELKETVELWRTYFEDVSYL